MDSYAATRRRREQNDTASILSVHHRSHGGTFLKYTLQFSDIFLTASGKERRPYITETFEMSANKGR